MPIATPQRLAALLVLLALPVGVHAQPSGNRNVHAPRSDNRLRDGLDSAVHQATVDLLSRSRAVGLSIGVISADGTVRSYGYGSTSLAHAVLPTPHTRYAIASITKTFIATLLAEAVVEGRLRLDDDVRRYLPGEYPNLAFAGQPIRLSHLITHLSGLPRNFPDSAVPASRTDRDRFYRELHRVVLDTFPGARLSYSNAAAQFLGFILERVYEQPLETLVSARITRPLKMLETKIALTASERAQMARGYDSAGAPVDASRFVSLQAAGALTSTVADMVRYLRWHAADRDSAVRITHQPNLTMGSYAEGLNWQMISGNGRRTIWQDGGLPGYTSLAAFSPELDVGVVILSTGRDYTSGLSVLASRILTALDSRVVPLP
jgi:D-alanyl-D-alanine-carboxypeptidase/D-alanyl-D-alanine-endopeptidase